MSGAVETLLARARVRITPREAWTVGAYARNAGLEEVGAFDSTAVCWCASGALDVEVREFSRAEYDTAYRTLAGVMPGGVVDFNDTSPHTAVLGAFDRAIALAKERGL